MRKNKDDRAVGRTPKHSTKGRQYIVDDSCHISEECVFPRANGVMSEVKDVNGPDLATIGIDSMSGLAVTPESAAAEHSSRSKQQRPDCHRRAGHQRHVNKAASHTNAVVHRTGAPSGMRF